MMRWRILALASVVAIWLTCAGNVRLAPVLQGLSSPSPFFAGPSEQSFYSADPASIPRVRKLLLLWRHLQLSWN